MQCFWVFVANNTKWREGGERLDIQWSNAYPSLILRSAFALPSRWLRSSSKLLLGRVLS